MRPRQFDVDQLLAIAFAHFQQRGVRGASISEIAEAAAIGRGSLYNAYPTKELLFLAAYRRHADVFVANLDKALSQGDLEARLIAFFDVCIDQMTAGEPALGCPTTRGLMELSTVPGDGLTEASRAVFSPMLCEIEQLLLATFRRAQTEQNWPGRPEAAAALTLVVARGLVVLERAFRDEARLRDIAREAVRQACVTPA